jgi:hypothetical protein
MRDKTFGREIRATVANDSLISSVSSPFGERNKNAAARDFVSVSTIPGGGTEYPRSCTSSHENSSMIEVISMDNDKESFSESGIDGRALSPTFNHERNEEAHDDVKKRKFIELPSTDKQKLPLRQHSRSQPNDQLQYRK